MIKTLTVAIQDTNKDDSISISGAYSDEGFNTVIVVTIGTHKIALNSQEFAQALAEVVKFQQTKPPPPPTVAETYGV